MRSFGTYTQPVAAEFMISIEQWSGHELLLLDTNEADSTAVAWLAPVGIQDATELTSLRWPALMLFIAACCFLGFRHKRDTTH